MFHHRTWKNSKVTASEMQPSPFNKKKVYKENGDTKAD